MGLILEARSSFIFFFESVAYGKAVIGAFRIMYEVVVADALSKGPDSFFNLYR